MIVSWLVNELVWKTMDSKVRSEELGVRSDSVPHQNYIAARISIKASDICPHRVFRAVKDK